jgi:HEAT repeat protein
MLIMSMVLALAGCSYSTEDWMEQLRDSEVVKRRAALRELGTRSAEAEQVVPALTEALRDENPYVRHDAALVLGKFGAQARQAVPALTVALKDKARSVRDAAGKALKKIDPRVASKAGIR